jgi:hypothetical protein
MAWVGNCETFRQEVLRQIAPRRGEAISKTGDHRMMGPFNRYDPMKWLASGLTTSMQVIEDTPPLEGEEISHYVVRLVEKLEKVKSDFFDDPDDEDGFGCGGVRDCIGVVEELG